MPIIKSLDIMCDFFGTHHWHTVPWFNILHESREVLLCLEKGRRWRILGIRLVAQGGLWLWLQLRIELEELNLKVDRLSELRPVFLDSSCYTWRGGWGWKYILVSSRVRIQCHCCCPCVLSPPVHLNPWKHKTNDILLYLNIAILRRNKNLLQ